MKNLIHATSILAVCLSVTAFATSACAAATTGVSVTVQPNNIVNAQPVTVDKKPGETVTVYCSLGLGDKITKGRALINVGHTHQVTEEVLLGDNGLYSAKLENVSPESNTIYISAMGSGYPKLTINSTLGDPTPYTLHCTVW